MKLLTKVQQKSYKNAKICLCICKAKIENKNLRDKEYHKFRNHCHYTKEYGGAVHSISNLRYSVPKNFYSFP